ncbi:MAG TPA: beta-galactosidase, partial [Tepidisphaeraceae bacterium]|nr:beta-galactosidase [Tepidisphaeraceae bacterium]
MRKPLFLLFIAVGCARETVEPASPPKLATAESNFKVELAPHPFATALLPNSPFGINTAFDPDTKDLDARLKAMQVAGIKWGRQDFTWRKIEKQKGQYDFEPYDRLVEACRAHGIMLIGDLAYAPAFHDPRTTEGVEAYCALARAAAKRYAGKVDHWQIWNEPNGGFWKGSPQQYAALLAASGKAIHETNPNAKVLGLNMAFCDVIWAEKTLNLVPYDCFDIACFHPYRPPSAPEEKFDWWEQDQYVKSWHKNDLKVDYPLVHMSFLEQADELIKVMAKFGKPKPLWVTEICWNTNIHPYGSNELRQADMLVRFYLNAI